MDHLRSVYSPILDLQNLEETFLARATQEYEARLNDDNFRSEQTKKWGRTNKKDQEIEGRDKAFSKYLNTLSIQLRLLSRTYQVIMKWNISTVRFVSRKLLGSLRMNPAYLKHRIQYYVFIVTKDIGCRT